jgi:hypothetical protein
VIELRLASRYKRDCNMTRMEETLWKMKGRRNKRTIVTYQEQRLYYILYMSTDEKEMKEQMAMDP